MLTRKCQFCKKEFQVSNKGSSRKNCDDHIGFYKRNYIFESGEMKRKCSKCNIFKDQKSFYKKQKGRGSSWCKDCFNQGVYTYQVDRALSRKIDLIKSKGGQCSKCGYNKNISGLVFHHSDPNQKDFNLDSRRLANSSFKKITEEIKKCILLCHNCHMEEHYPQFNGLL